MNKLKTVLISGLISLFSTSVFANSENFAGPYIGLMSSVNGVTFDASHNSTSGDVTTGSAGKHAIIVGGEIGYVFPLGDLLAIDIGYNMVSGEAKLKTGTDRTTAIASDDVTFSASDPETYYIAPTIAVSETSSFYFKYGESEADVAVTGTVTDPGDMKGTTYALGSRTVLSNGIFVRTEAGYTEYDKLTVTGTGALDAATGKVKGVNTSTSVTADPTIAYGLVSVGYKF
jgi:hypothetical protein